MKFRITMKTPDCAAQNIEDVVGSALFNFEGTPEEEEEKSQELTAELTQFLEKWIKYGELAVIEFDTEAGTAKVIPVSNF